MFRVPSFRTTIPWYCFSQTFVDGGVQIGKQYVTTRDVGTQHGMRHRRKYEENDSTVRVRARARERETEQTKRGSKRRRAHRTEWKKKTKINYMLVYII